MGEISLSTKRAKQNQQYDEYWKLTVEYTDIFGAQFNNTLKVIVKFIDDNIDKINNIDIEKYNNKDKEEKNKFQELYGDLQSIIFAIYHKADLGSTRKSINQFVKLGFISPYLKGYHKLTKRFLNIPSSDREMKKSIFSEIFYDNASFNSSITNDNTNKKEINFLLKTLMYHPNKMLSKQDIIALMVTDLSSFSKGYLTIDELRAQYSYSEAIAFEDNKYNQIAYMFTFLNLMPDLTAHKDKGVAFAEDGLVLSDIDTTRDPYMHALYRNNLKLESKRVYNNIVCYVEKIAYKGLVASHIKPCHICLEELNTTEAYDYNNGLLIQQNIDAYFDKFDISFNDDGTMLISSNVDKNIAEKYCKYTLDKEILTPERLKYLSYHRDRFFEKHAS